jgi:electron transport complex protein RnfB
MSSDITFVIDERTCIECGNCRRYCPVPGAVIITEAYQHTILADICTGCGICEAFCPVPNTIFAIRRADAEPALDPARRHAAEWLRARRHLVWRERWRFHDHPIMGKLAHKARAHLRRGNEAAQ